MISTIGEDGSAIGWGNTAPSALDIKSPGSDWGWMKWVHEWPCTSEQRGATPGATCDHSLCWPSKAQRLLLMVLVNYVLRALCGVNGRSGHG